MKDKKTIDARHLLCPLPVIRTQDTVKTLGAGTIVEVICTDPGVMQDIPAWCKINGHTILSTLVKDLEYIITLQVNAHG